MAHYAGLSCWASFKVFSLLGLKKKCASVLFFGAAGLSILF